MSLIYREGIASDASRSWAVVVPLWPALWALALLGALWLRLGAIDAAPLAPSEAARALAAQAVWQGTAGPAAAGPLYTHLLAVWMVLFGFADGPARVPSALAAWGLCLTPLLFRTRLGPVAALGAAALLAVSPLGILLGRTAHPAALVTLATSAAVGCLVAAWDRQDGRWLIGTGLAVGIGLGASPGFVGQALAVIVALAVSSPLAGVPWARLRAWAPRAVGAGLAAAVVLDTLLLTRPSGVQAGLVDPFPNWVASLGWSVSSRFAAGLFGLQEALLVAFAVLGAIATWRDSFTRFLVVWAVSAAALALLTEAPDLSALGAPLVPLALLGGRGLASLGWLRSARRPVVWLTALAMLVPLTFLVFTINLSLNRGNPVGSTSFVVAAGGLVAVALVATTWLTLSELRLSAALVLGVGLLAAEVTFLSRLDYAGFERGGPFLASASSRPELRLVEAQARDWWRQDPDAPLLVDASLRPILEWSLRDGAPVEWVTRAPSGSYRVILGDALAADRPAGEWRRLVVAERYRGLSEPPMVAAVWRWLVLRQAFVRSEPYAILIAQ